ncbi:hypothetical protein TRFO_11909 [Tritrichomonas foetus]|uniref:WD repeat protein n=1 Tax=Tritrichomonas foetus TaxID=1144522 RepID=A0A1J4J7T7_9EUKA|nr:hypothetical protein TRFO_11909 [Tritrichomonas foetus]|eukprot:OHS93292.1 hypothetical protein TRFO_11909 [Tritrichomonas foetus]
MCWVLENAFSIHTVTASLLHDIYLYVGNDDYAIRVWNTATSSLHNVLQGHTSVITGLAYSTKYDLLFSVGIDGNLCAWHGRACVYKYTHYKPPGNRFPAAIYSIYFSNDLDIVVIGLDSEVATFELSTKMIDVLVDNANKSPFIFRQSCKMHSDRVHYVIGGGRRIYTASYDRTVSSATILDISINKQISRHQTAVSTMIFDNMTQNLIVGDNSGIIRTFSADGLSLGPLAEGLEGSVTSLFYDQSLRLLWFVLSNGTISLMDPIHNNANLAEHFQIFKNLPLAGSDTTHFEKIMGNSDRTKICALVNHKYIYCWKWSELTYSFKLEMPNKPIQRLFAFNYTDEDIFSYQKRRSSSRRITNQENLPSYAKINSSLVNHGLNLFAAGSKIIASRPISEFLYTNDDIYVDSGSTAIDFNYQESEVIIGYNDGRVTIVSLASPRIYNDTHASDVSITNIISIGSVSITIADDMSLVLWDVHDRLEVISKRDRIHDNAVTCSAVCEKRRIFITCDDSGFGRVWHLNEENQIKEEMLIDHSSFGPISHVCYSKSADSWIFAAQDGFIRVWPVDQPLSSPSFNFNVMPCHVTAMAAGNNNDIYIATEDKTIRLMSLRHAQELGVYIGHSDLITQIIVPPVGKRWVSLQWNGEVYFWVFKTKEKPKAIDDKVDRDISKLPQLSKRPEPQRSKSAAEKEKPISFYDKARKTLLLKRREEERQLKQKKKSHTWKMLVAMTQQIENAMDTFEAEKKAKEEGVKNKGKEKPKQSMRERASTGIIPRFGSNYSSHSNHSNYSNHQASLSPTKK